MRNVICVFMVFLACALASGPVQAAPRDEAIAKNAEAQQLFAAGNFAAAGEQFRIAYGIYPEPMILVGEAVAWFKADVCRDAVAAAELFLTRAEQPTETDRADMGRIRAECTLRDGERFLEAGEIDAAQARLETAVTLDTHETIVERLSDFRAALDAKRASIAAKSETSDAAQADLELPAEPTPAPGWVTRRYVGAGLLALSGLSAAGSVAVFATQRQDFAAFKADPTARGDDRARLVRLRGLNYGLGIGAAVAASVGVPLFFWPSGEKLSLVAGSGGALVGLQLRR